MRDLTGHRFGAIELIVLIGRGGMGEVYRGFDHKLGRAVAVKTIRPDSRISAELKARFVREARLLSRIGHPAICLVYDLVETPEADFLVLEFINGQNLRQLLAVGIVGDQLLDIAIQVARALAAAHEHKVVHRDLKPDNVMVTASGQVKVLDFGIARSLGEEEPAADEGQPLPAVASVDTLLAESSHGEPLNAGFDTQRVAAPASAEAATRVTLPDFLPSGLPRSESAYLTQAGAVLGTRRYMSPEQAAGKPVDTSTDLYAFGVLLEELVEAWKPAAPARAGVPVDPELSGLIRELKQSDPARRPNAAATAERLADLREKPQRLRRQRLRRWLLLASTLVLAVLLAITVIALLDARRARAIAETRTRQAEDLIGFMMTDLRSKLAQVGKLELLDTAGQRALAYFEQAGTAMLTAGELQTLLLTLNQLTELRITNARYPEAHELSKRAQALARERLQLEPEQTATWASLLCQAQVMEAYAWLEQEQSDLAAQVLSQAADRCDQALAAAPPTADVLRIAAAAWNAQGAQRVLAGQARQAIAALEKSVGAYDQLLRVADGAATRGELAATLGWLSSAREADWDLPGAQAARDRNVQLLTGLRQLQPDDRVVEADLCVALRYRARLELAAGAVAEAVVTLSEALALSEGLHHVDPDNLLWRRDLALQRTQLGWALALTGELREGATVLDQALSELRALLELDPANTDRQRLLAQVEQRRAAVALKQMEVEPALRLLSAARGRWEALIAGNAELPANRLGLAQTALTLAQANQAAGSPVLAGPALSLASQQLDAIPAGSRDAEVLATQLLLYRLTGESAAAAALDQRLRAGGYAWPELP